MVDIVQVERFRAFDGRTFDTREEAEAHEEKNFANQHEEKNFANQLVALSAATIEKALARDPSVLAISDAIEKAGNIIAKARREAGELRRPRKGEGKSSTQPKPAGEPEASDQEREVA